MKSKTIRCFEATLTCVHPLCIRWPQGKKSVRKNIWMPPGGDPVAAARFSFAVKHERKCKECHRVISLDHLQLRELDPASGDYLEVATHE